MAWKRLALLSLGLGVLLVWQVGASEPACPPGHQLVEEIAYKEVVRHVCRVVPETRQVKQWVYSCREEPFCIPGVRKACGHHEHTASCVHCRGPYVRRQLVKREIVVEEVCGTKCVVEKIVEKIPYIIYHPVPISTDACGFAPLK